MDEDTRFVMNNAELLMDENTRFVMINVELLNINERRSAKV